ncbi:MAG: (d)CMP kinase, partial [Clostridia bacterium]|nr:(d)CMP kinase [Clostridia bacterium]
MSFVVAIDGPAGTGKGTVTKIVAEKLNLIYIDTGAMYRAVTLKALKNNIMPDEIQKIEGILKDISITLNRQDSKQQVLLDGEDITEEIRTTQVDNYVAKFAAVKLIRDKMTPLQREMKSQGNIIMEGRDVGTIVFPDAEVKIYLDATVEERANRRYKQNIEKGIECNYEEILAGIKERHILETTREIAPLRQADDAVYLDSTKLSIDEVVEKIISIIEGKINF